MNDSQTIDLIMKNEIKDGIAIARINDDMKYFASKHNKFVRFTTSGFMMLGSAVVMCGLGLYLLGSRISKLERELKSNQETEKEE